MGRSKREMSKGGGRRAVVVSARKTTASVTNILIGLSIAMFAVELAVGGSASLFNGPTSAQLVRLGGAVPYFPIDQFHPAAGAVGVATGEYWRIFVSMFLHIGLIHIALNMYGLWLFGRIIEDELGSMKMLGIYLISGLAGGAFSYAFGPRAVSVGASGAIYGLLGTFVAYNYRRRNMRFYRARLQAIMPWVFFNLFLSFEIRFIDWHAHVGGLVVGAIALYIVEAPGSRTTRRAIIVAGFVALAALTVGLSLYGTAHWRSIYGLS